MDSSLSLCQLFYVLIQTSGLMKQVKLFRNLIKDSVDPYTPILAAGATTLSL